MPRFRRGILGSSMNGLSGGMRYGSPLPDSEMSRRMMVPYALVRSWPLSCGSPSEPPSPSPR